MSTDTDAGIEDPGGDERPARDARGLARLGGRTLRVLTLVLTVVLVVAVAAAVWAWSREHAADRRSADRADATSVAEQFALRVDTFDGKDIDEYTKSVQALLTTKYKAEFDKQFEPFKEVFAQAQATGTGKVLVSGVGSYDEDSATVLVAHDASVKSKLGDQVRHQRWSIDLVKVGGDWRVDDFNPVN